MEGSFRFGVFGGRRVGSEMAYRRFLEEFVFLGLVGESFRKVS